MPIAKHKTSLSAPVAVFAALVFSGAVLAGVLLHRRHRSTGKEV